VPYQANGERASSTDPATWRSYAEVCQVWREHPDRYSGIGYVFSAEDPYCGVDLDNCLSDGETKDWAGSILHQFSDIVQACGPEAGK
jgi:putative DNA primase/helicase